MSDRSTFEARLVDALERYADRAATDVDGPELAAIVAANQSASGRLARAAGTFSGAARVLLVAAVVAALIGAALVVGSHRRPPPPFGLAANGLIAFDLAGDLYLGNPTTGTSKLLLGGPARESDPVFSPDGGRVALIRSSGQPAADDVVVLGVDGSRPTVVTVRPLPGLRSVEWAPDGTELAIVALVGSRHALLLAMADGSGIRTIVDDVDIDVPVYRPPNGREVLFRAMTAHGPGLFVINADGSNRRTVIEPKATGNPAYDLREPRYSPDGSRIAFMTWLDGPRQMRTYVMPADGTGAAEVMHDPRAWFAGWPVWSPDGTRLVLIRQFYGSDGEPVDSGRPFAVGWVDGRAPTIETGPPMTSGDQRASWSPDGRELLVKGDDRQLILDPAGGPWQTLPWDSNAYPAWQRTAP